MYSIYYPKQGRRTYIIYMYGIYYPKQGRITYYIHV